MGAGDRAGPALRIAEISAGARAFGQPRDCLGGQHLDVKPGLDDPLARGQDKAHMLHHHPARVILLKDLLPFLAARAVEQHQLVTRPPHHAIDRGFQRTLVGILEPAPEGEDQARARQRNPAIRHQTCHGEAPAARSFLKQLTQSHHTRPPYQARQKSSASQRPCRALSKPSP